MKRSLLFILILLSIFNCKYNKKNAETWAIELPETRKTTALIQWAVVMYSLPKLREYPVINSKILNYIPLGKIVRVIKKENQLSVFENEAGYWCYIDYDGEKGWIFSTFLEIYNNFDEAEKKGEELLLTQ